MKKKAVLFDAYGTLFDVYSVTALAESLYPGCGARLATVWRDKQLEYSRLRALSGHYKSFWGITQDALEYTRALLKLDMSHSDRSLLLDAYRDIVAHPECRGVLQAIQQSGLQTGILSNGNPEMLDRATRSAGLNDCLDQILSVEPLETFKTDPRVYQMGLDAFNLDIEQVLFVSSNGWDACAARWFGLETVWVNRAGLPHEQLDVQVSHETSSLQGVLSALSIGGL